MFEGRLICLHYERISLSIKIGRPTVLGCPDSSLSGLLGMELAAFRLDLLYVD